MTKRCSKCREEKDPRAFHKNKTKKLGLSNECKECAITRSKNYREKNKKRIAEKKRHYQQKKKHEISARKKISYQKNRDKVRSRQARYYKENRDQLKKKARIQSKKYYENNKERVFATAAKRRADRIGATPSWANLVEIRWAYEACPEGHHVDHIIPLKGENVCGLHVENNLQWLTAEENIRKGNKFPYVKED